MTRQMPRWAREIAQAIDVQPHFVISGNIHDCYLVDTGDGPTRHTVESLVADIVTRRGIRWVLVYDVFSGLRLVRGDLNSLPDRLPGLSIRPDGTFQPMGLDAFAQCLEAASRARDEIAFIVEFCGHIQIDHDASERFFARCDMIAHRARRLPRASGSLGFNPVFWLAGQTGDVPTWFGRQTDNVRFVSAGYPGQDERRIFIRHQAAVCFRQTISPDMLDVFVDDFVQETEGMRLRNLEQIMDLFLHHDYQPSQLHDAIRGYRFGIYDDPWRQSEVHRRIAAATETISERVIGQTEAINKSVDILIRSATALSGAQGNRRGGRPRGVLFFAGPTGVGKTETAKAITEVLFGDESAYHRFDMSEFSDQHAQARLLGAPPGYVGFEQGGELVDRVRERPFSVLLFDEIEKAHRSVFDKFLQILEDGRLTDGQGRTVFFSETVIIFTSNLGTRSRDETQQPLVTWGVPYTDLKRIIRESISDFFKAELQRPELLNRIGDNIVVFNFIERGVAGRILETMLRNIARRVQDEHGLSLSYSDEVIRTVTEDCLSSLEDGGRGIGNRLETMLINPLGRALFAAQFQPGGRITAHRFEGQGAGLRLIVE
ncbi:AAA family ATPase [Hyphomonas sp.]|uniref:AAA family ATPase n=1 Tax=Hyphomonas sp. TaxID=87 RepID=UPI0025C479C9|nr:AAA family ATPase [Hyphomonas sp.]